MINQFRSHTKKVEENWCIEMNLHILVYTSFFGGIVSKILQYNVKPWLDKCQRHSNEFSRHFMLKFVFM